MSEAFGESIAPTAAIRAILGSYPFSIGLLREILQNSDDAKATKQVFVLDRRYHGVDALCHPYLAAVQGPALLAYNNALIQDDDWKALKNIHQSSKTTDTSKIGKHGIGFRSCYHITDTPHILSGQSLAILDPKHEFAEVSGVRIGGVKLNVQEHFQKYADHLTAFDSLLPYSDRGSYFDGAIFRLPLRTTPSQISTKIISPDEISDLLRDFAMEELDISLLFLRSVSSIEIYEISADGEKIEVARATIDRAPMEKYAQYEIRKATIQTFIADSSEGREWRIIHALFPEDGAVEALSRRLGGDPTATLSQHKLSPTVDLAIPLDPSDSTRIGRLFTFLPLPLLTEFPIHINALFSLTQSRQNLRNGGEVGIVKNSADHALIEWNRLLFDTYIPQAWAALLEVLVVKDHLDDIFSAWPRPQADVHSGDYVYWKEMPLHIIRHALDLRVWPVFGTDPPSYQTSTSLFIAETSTEDNILSALIRAGVLVMQPPQYITEIMRDTCSVHVRILSPDVAYDKLKSFTKALKALDATDAQAILGYLLSTSQCRYIVGLPLVPSVSGTRIALAGTSALRKPRVLLDEAEEELFNLYDDGAVSLRQLAPMVRQTLVSRGPGVLNLTKLTTQLVVTYLNASTYDSRSQETATSDQIRWLNEFWDWVQSKFSNLSFCDTFYLVPGGEGRYCPSETVFDPQSDEGIARLLELLGVPVVDPRMDTRARGALRCLESSTNIHALLRMLSTTTGVELSEEQANDLCNHLITYLPSSCARHGPISSDKKLRQRLRALPIFPTISPSPDSTQSSRRMSITSTATVRGVDPLGISILPQVDSIVYLDLRTISQDFLQYLDSNHRSPLSVNEMQDLMLQHFGVQSLEMQVAFIRYLDSNSDIISRGILDRLKATAFVPACDGSLRSPKSLVDPRATIATLFPGASPSLPDTSRPILRTLVDHLRNLSIFTTELSAAIICDRIHFIAGGQCSRPESLARTLINLINTTRFDCRDLFDQPGLSSELEWLPTPEGLKCPLKCRDLSSHSSKTDLFDEVMPTVVPDVHIGYYLRQAFEWDGEIPFEILSQQVMKVLDAGEPSYKKVREIIKELGHRGLTPEETSSLRSLLEGRRWVPTRSGTLETVAFALLGGEDIPEIGFHSIVFDPQRHSKVRLFLRQMGCSDRPSKDTIFAHLKSLYESDLTELPDKRVAHGLIRLLNWLPRIAPDERTSLFIPDTSGILRPFESVYYNDIGPRACLVDTGSGALVHPSISPQIASDLGLRRLGLMNLQNQIDDDPDMGEDLMTTIRNRLREYSDSQLLLEFLANASDAGATEFNVLLDEQLGPTKALLSPRCSDFQRVPSLVVHNNSVFSDSDFKGILRTGIGGKTDRKDTIGQFGLGALTMFHITELAMIVSRDQVLFLNPCRAHLSVDRAALRLPLSRVRKLYGDHLSPLLGLFGFDLPDANEDYSYNGTLFRLPLRSSAQLQGIEPIFKKTTLLRDIAFNFKSLASNCLLFTSMTSIRLFDRKHHGPMLLWSATASRGDTSKVGDDASAYTVTIGYPDPLERAREWRVISVSVNDQQLSPFISSLQEKYRLRLPPVTRIAACLSPSHPQHNLFATLPLPIPLDLPVHISGSFILASDRRSIRLDEYENLEATYNRWLLTTVIPMLYLCLLEERASVSDNAIYWPGNTRTVSKDSHNALSSIVTRAVYQMAATSDRHIFRSKFHPHALTPDIAYLSYYLPSVIHKALKMIRPAELVDLPSSVTRQLRDVEGGLISCVSPMYIHDQILGSSKQFAAEELEFDKLQELIDYLSTGSDAHNCLLGLKLLPLEDGDLAKFQNSSQSCFYVLPPGPTNIFKPHRIIDYRLNTLRLLDINTLNVKPLSAGDISALLNDFLLPSPVLDNAEPALCTWIGKFWKAFSGLRISMTAISNYPLVSTTILGNYVSISHCKTCSIIVADFSGHEWLAQCFTQMGFTPVDTTRLSLTVQPALTITSISVENVLSILINHSLPILLIFSAMDSDNHARFVRWVRKFFAPLRPKYFKNPRHAVYKSLPIWESIDGSHVSASDAIMLPRQVDGEAIAPFALAPQVITTYHSTLFNMGIRETSSIQNLLDIPTILKEEQEEAYLEVAGILISNGAKTTSIPLPNSRWEVKESNTLYSSRDDLFLAAFGTNSEHFLLPAFRHLESRLGTFGLKRQMKLNMKTFKDCVHAFRTSTGPDLVNRAAVIFGVFSEDLPLRANTVYEAQWRGFDELRFIPRNMSPQPFGGIDASKYIAPHVGLLPCVVSPNELVRKEFIAVAWSQRAVYRTEPHQRILMVYSDLSSPRVGEVVNHLVVLATRVAKEEVRNVKCHATLLDHLKQTYTFLNNYAEDAKQHLIQCTENGIPLFLNVDIAPKRPGDWNWKRANCILLDDYDTGFLECPRDFIKPFRPLLVAAGAVSIDYGQEVGALPKQPTSEDLLTNLRSRFNRMRREGICTDVNFVCDSPDDTPLCAHRAYLAAYTNYFEGMFSGSFREAGDASKDNPILVRVEKYSRRCVEHVLDYVYTAKEPNLRRDESDIDLALEMLSLTHFWLLTDAQGIMQNIIIKLRMVDPFNLDQVRSAAEETCSVELESYCDTYETKNQHLIKQAREESAVTLYN
ncbi:hypothetical protein P691DRAFT_733572 [Macrolepiota fuliginosa MF-IS2]|uniref:BTB domain-containing protein n=1 Tax=Macrolepiota fuliginosa MF-IS2 TaxID=1400762 RepID=A0A9P5X7I3_9AGAR|nr:hypothetical protein P691DRAFT_733572 [Macrolepiota fuliginosa MF-IS2]